MGIFNAKVARCYVAFMDARPAQTPVGESDADWISLLRNDPGYRTHIRGAVAFSQQSEPWGRLYYAYGEDDRYVGSQPRVLHASGLGVGGGRCTKYNEDVNEGQATNGSATFAGVLDSIRFVAPAPGDPETAAVAETRCSRGGVSVAVPPGWTCKNVDHWLEVWEAEATLSGVDFSDVADIPRGTSWNNAE